MAWGFKLGVVEKAMSLQDSCFFEGGHFSLPYLQRMDDAYVVVSLRNKEIYCDHLLLDALFNFHSCSSVIYKPSSITEIVIFRSGSEWYVL